MPEAKKCRTCGHPKILYGDTWKCLVCGKRAVEKDGNRKSVIIDGFRDKKKPGEKKTK